MLAGCGFHLRGVQSLPSWLNKVSVITTHVSPEWGPIMKRQLQLAHVMIVDDPTEAPYWLTIQNERMQQNISSISSGSSPRQYQLTYHVQFTLQRAKGTELIAPSTIVVTRLLTINNDRILGSHDEEEQLKQEMRRDAAVQILYRLEPMPHTLLSPTILNTRPSS
jgi:LPS-assembly lipoprotein